MDTKKLRQKILDLAIRGKLVPQDPNDEPASVLLERIRAEKERLIKEGKIKRSKKSASDTPYYENEVPFKAPEGWEWCRLSEIANYGGGKTPSMDNKQYWSNGTNLWITSKDMKSERITDSMMKISNEALDIMTQYEPGTLLMVTRSGILRHTLPIAILEEKATVNQDLKTISLYLKGIHEYVYYAIKAREHYILKEYHKDGTTVDSINFEKFAEIPLPIPPYNEQKRIVTAIKQWLSFIEELEKETNDLESSIQQTKSKILDLAIHGKLVTQDPSDEPAIELLRRINPKFTPCDNAQCENTPMNWIKCHVGDMANIIGGVSYKKDDVRTNGIRILRGGNIQNGKVLLEDDDVFVSYEYHDSENEVKDGDIVVVSSTGSSTLIGKTGFANKVPRITQIGAFLRILRFSNYLSREFINLIFLSEDYKDYIRNIAKGSNINNIKNNYLSDYIISIPPYPEQLRIVTKIEELFAVLDEIQESIEA